MHINTLAFTLFTVIGMQNLNAERMFENVQWNQTKVQLDSDRPDENNSPQKGTFLNKDVKKQDYSYNKIFQGIMYWSVRRGSENQEFNQSAYNTMTSTTDGTEKLEFKSSRTTFDILGANFSTGFSLSGPLLLGFNLGSNVGFSLQKQKSTYSSAGTFTPGISPPSGYNGNQGMDMATENWALSFGMKAGFALAYQINKKKNLNVSIGISEHFWGKGNMGWYVNPKFFGSFWDANLTYKKYALYTTYRSRSFDNSNYGSIKASYLSLMPTMNFKGNSIVGLRVEFTKAKAENSVTQDNFIRSYTLDANSLLIGVYFALGM